MEYDGRGNHTWDHVAISCEALLCVGVSWWYFLWKWLGGVEDYVILKAGRVVSDFIIKKHKKKPCRWYHCHKCHLIIQDQNQEIWTLTAAWLWVCKYLFSVYSSIFKWFIVFKHVINWLIKMNYVSVFLYETCTELTIHLWFCIIHA